MYPATCADEDAALLKFAEWMHEHYKNTLKLAAERAGKHNS